MVGIKIIGEVIGGKKIGRRLGFPTANIAVDAGLEVGDGVYAVEAEVEGRRFYGVANLGVRPTIEGGARGRLLEVNLFDCEADLYGLTLAVELVCFLRPERKFGSLEELQTAIARDRAAAEEYFAERKETKSN